MRDYPRLPDPPAPEPDDSAALYGCRLLQWYLQAGVYCTSSPEQLQAAEHSAYVAVTARGILPIAVDRLSDVRHAIHDQLRRLERIAAEAPAPALADGCSPIGAPADDEPGGPSGRVPRRPYPINNPPAAGIRIPEPAPVINF